MSIHGNASNTTYSPFQSSIAGVNYFCFVHLIAVDFENVKNVWKICAPILLVFGTFGNCMSIIVLQRPTIRKYVGSIYLIALAATDLVVLYTGLLREWLLHAFDFDIRLNNNVTCKILTWILYSSLYISAWILIAVTFERLFLVWFPGKMKTIHTKRVAIGNILVIGMILLLFNLHIPINYTINDIKEKQICSANFENGAAFELDRLSLSVMDLVLFCIIPAVALMVGNILICIKVFRSKRKIVRQVSISSKLNKFNHAKFSSMTITLVFINAVFLVCNVPSSIFLIKNSQGSCKRIDAIIWCVVNFPVYINNSVNFLLYVISGRKFREEIKQMFRLTKSRHIAETIIPHRFKPKRSGNFDIFSLSQSTTHN